MLVIQIAFRPEDELGTIEYRCITDTMGFKFCTEVD
jgi:hypothetical protein